MSKTRIEWVRNFDRTQGWTVNPVKGLCPMACPYCYARRMYKRFKWNPEIRFEDDVLYSGLPLVGKDGDRYFVGSTIELFGDWIQDSWLKDIFEWTQLYPNRTFIFLTRQPQELIKWSPFPENCWVGMTLTDRHFANNARQFLLGVAAKVKFLSLEPLLGHMDGWALANAIHLADWLIIGQQTPVSAKTQPKIEWIREIVEAADKAGIPVFLKDNLMPIFQRGDIWAIPEWASFNDWTKQDIGTTLRQEMPK